MSTGSPMGDVLRAWLLLEAGDAEARARIAAALGMAWSPTGKSAAARTSDPAGGGSKLMQPLATPSSGRPQASAVARAVTIEITPPAKPGATEEEVLGAEGMETQRELAPFPAKPPLLNPQWMRGIFSSRLSQTAPSRRLDFATILRHELRARTLRRLPWRRVQTMSAGVRCYIDVGAPLDILLDDRVQVLRGLRALAGFERVTYGFFETVPDESDARVDEASELATASDAPVLILTDFGHYSVPGRRWATAAEWQMYLARERARGTRRIVALTPLLPASWPASLLPELEIVLWDWQTGVGKSRRHAH